MSCLISKGKIRWIVSEVMDKDSETRKVKISMRPRNRHSSAIFRVVSGGRARATYSNCGMCSGAEVPRVRDGSLRVQSAHTSDRAVDYSLGREQVYQRG